MGINRVLIVLTTIKIIQRKRQEAGSTEDFMERIKETIGLEMNLDTVDERKGIFKDNFKVSKFIKTFLRDIKL